MDVCLSVGSHREGPAGDSASRGQGPAAEKGLALQCYHLADQKQLLSGLEKQVDSSYFSSISME